jgi:hypothetical protein
MREGVDERDEAKRRILKDNNVCLLYCRYFSKANR